MIPTTTLGSLAERARPHRVRLLAAVAVVLVCCLQPPVDQFRADGGTYWDGSLALLSRSDVYERGLWELRGVLTAVVYLPAALVQAVADGRGAGFLVLLQNSCLISLVGTVLLPTLVARWRPVSSAALAVSATLTALVLRGFAPYPLMDLWAAALVLGGVVLVRRPTTPRLLAAGVAAGLAFNLRPASLLPVVLVLAVVVVAVHRRSGWWALGAVLGLLPQVIANRHYGLSLLPWPRETFELGEVQAGLAAYTVRYDTVDTPAFLMAQFYCSPGMAGRAVADPPASMGQLAGFLLRSMPESMVFSAQKVASALHWPLAIPYSTSASGSNAAFALMVTTVTVVGLAALVRARRTLRAASVQDRALVAVGIGTVVSLVASATEARFALLLVLLGVAGCALVAAGRHPEEPGRLRRRRVIGTTTSVLAVLGVFAVGVSGLADPAETGLIVTPASCAELG